MVNSDYIVDNIVMMNGQYVQVSCNDGTKASKSVNHDLVLKPMVVGIYHFTKILYIYIHINMYIYIYTCFFHLTTSKNKQR